MRLGPSIDPRALLISWNADPELPRGAVCRFGEDPLGWLERSRSPQGGLSGFDRRTLRRLAERASTADAIAAAELSRLRSLGARIVTRLDGDYPAALLDLALPPPVLAVCGHLPDRPAVAIVGARRASPYGLEVAEWFGRALAREGVLVVSGFAVGIDATAHQAALSEPDGATVAVLGCGLDVEYPKAHARLRSEICARGALVTEFPCGARPEPWRFPIRNRLIAALCQAVVVVEAAPRSGSLVTARLALELGREIFAVPGRLSDELALGPNALLEQGARPALTPQAILEALGPLPSRPGSAAEETGARLAGSDPLLALLRDQGPLCLEALAAALGEAPGPLGARLLELELAERVRHLPGGLFEARA